MRMNEEPIHIRVNHEYMRFTYCQFSHCGKADTCKRYKLSGNEQFLTVYFVAPPEKDKDGNCKMYLSK